MKNTWNEPKASLPEVVSFYWTLGFLFLLAAVSALHQALHHAA